jgi:SOS-response transcriptional repressor LexA
VASVGDAAGLASKSTVHHHLSVLRRAGLVGWADDRRGTLRALVRPVALRVAL